MELLNEFIFLGAALIAVSIVAGMFSSRIGAPLLLVFLGLGMLVRVEAPDYARLTEICLRFGFKSLRAELERESTRSADLLANL